MNSTISFGEILFRSAAFSLLLYKSIDFIRYHLTPWIKQAAQRDHNELTKLLETDNLLSNATSKITTQIHQQDQLLAILEHKIKLWHSRQIEKNKALQQEQYSIASKQHILVAKQQEMLALRMNILATSTLAFQKATEILCAQSSQEAAQSNLNNLIKQLPTLQPREEQSP